MNPSDKFSGQDASRGHAVTGRDEFRLRAESYLRQDLFREAMALARERIGLYPGDGDARLIFGIALFKTGRKKEALTVLEELKEDILRWARAFEYLGDIYSGQDEIEKARSCYLAFLSLGSDTPRVERLLKKVESLGDPERGSRGGFSLGDSRDFKTLTMAELYLKQGHVEQAAVVLEEIVKKQPESERAAELLREARALLSRRNIRQQSPSSGAVMEELNRWLRNLKR